MWAVSESAATWFRRARLRAGYRSQGELARVLGLSRAAVANWESETVRGRPSRSVLPHLSRLLSVAPEELAARYGIDVARPMAEPAGLSPDVLAAIEEAVARGVARGLHEALGARHEEAPLVISPALEGVAGIQQPAVSAEEEVPGAE
jgi:transcriptional regulator with XRE-family HTH domain